MPVWFLKLRHLSPYPQHLSHFKPIHSIVLSVVYHNQKEILVNTWTGLKYIVTFYNTMYNVPCFTIVCQVESYNLLPKMLERS